MSQLSVPRVRVSTRLLLVCIGVALALSVPALALDGPPVLKWQRGGCFASWCQTGWYASPAVADLDGDGHPEVIWGAYDLVVLDGATGALKWRGPNDSRIWPGIAVADLKGDGTKAIIVGRGGDQLTVYGPTGAVLWTRNPFGGGEVRTLAVEDLDGDGRLEIVVGRASGGATRQLNVFDADGNVRPGWPARRDGEPGYGWGMYNENVAIGDLDGDGLMEVIGPTDTHYITALDRNGNQLAVHAMFGAGKVWSQGGVHVDLAADLRGYAMCGTEHRPNFANSAPVIADLNGDGVPEIIVVGDVYDCAQGDPDGDLYHVPFIFRRDRTRWSGSGFDWTVLPVPGPGSGPLSQDYDVIENSVQNVVVADLDGDGVKEILFPSYDGKLHAYWLDKTEHGNWPYRVPGPGIRFASEPVVVDLDDDGRAEVIFTSWPDKSTGGVGQLHVLDYLGNPLYVIDLPAPVGGATWNGALGAPTLANIDGDPDLVVIGTVASGVVAYTLPGTAHARVLWGTGRGNYRRTGTPPGDSLTTFADVRSTHWARTWIETLYAAGVTGGCATDPLRYCPELAVTRGQMAVFLLRAREGAAFVPPACTAPVFADVPCSDPFAPWIGELVQRGVTAGCGGGRYCPAAPVTREQMAVFLLKALDGAGFQPPGCTAPQFGDVPCTSPFATWVNELVARGITAGCTVDAYCPAAPVTRAQMAVFLVRTFSLAP
jgi:hypothetical protein